MENFSYRKGARVAAYIDVVLSTITFIRFLLEIVAEAKIMGPFVAGASRLLYSNLIRLYCSIGAVFCIVEIWAAIMLLLATNEGADAIQALRRARIWKDPAQALYLLDFVNWFALFILLSWRDLADFYIILGWFIALSIIVIFRTVILFYAEKFIDEVDMLTRLKGQQLV